MTLETLILIALLGVSVSMRPWRLLRGSGSALLTPLFASLTLLPWLWALPRMHAMPLALQLSGACAVTLMLGWPLAVPVLVLVGLLSAIITPAPVAEIVAQIVWFGLVPSTLSLGLGVGLRRWFGERPFLYILGRGFLGTVLCTFAGASLALWMGHDIAHTATALGLVGRWLLAWGDGFMTGMLTAIFVAFKPQWLATWSDRLYLRQR